ncbi:hypothetical protein RB195_021065 [Necator americanus]|uniref:IgGFc-binding protein N-terminal domain-containing protein n=1 Tax=Necator americanus TaxID=51031 RepID=A0ABR1E962_NECAM
MQFLVALAGWFVACAAIPDSAGTSFIFGYVRDANWNITNQVLSVTVLNGNSVDCNFTIKYRDSYDEEKSPLQTRTFNVPTANMIEVLVPSWYGWQYDSGGMQVDTGPKQLISALSTCPVTLIANNYDNTTFQGDSYLVLPSTWARSGYVYAFTLPPASNDVTNPGNQHISIIPTQKDVNGTLTIFGSDPLTFTAKPDGATTYFVTKTPRQQPYTYHIQADGPILILAGVTCAGSYRACDHAAFMPQPLPSSACYQNPTLNENHPACITITNGFYVDVSAWCSTIQKSEVDMVYWWMVMGIHQHLVRLSELVNENRLLFFSHVTGAPSDRLVQVVLGILPDPNWKRPRGRKLFLGGHAFSLVFANNVKRLRISYLSYSSCIDYDHRLKVTGSRGTISKEFLLSPTKQTSLLSFDASFGGGVNMHSETSTVHVTRYHDFSATGKQGAFIDAVPSISQFITGNSTFYTRNDNDLIEVICVVAVCTSSTIDGVPMFSLDKNYTTIGMIDGVNYYALSIIVPDKGFHIIHSGANGTYSYYVVGQNQSGMYGYIGGVNMPKIDLLPTTTSSSTTTGGTTTTIQRSLPTQPVTLSKSSPTSTIVPTTTRYNTRPPPAASSSTTRVTKSTTRQRSITSSSTATVSTKSTATSDGVRSTLRIQTSSIPTLTSRVTPSKGVKTSHSTTQSTSQPVKVPSSVTPAASTPQPSTATNTKPQWTTMGTRKTTYTSIQTTMTTFTTITSYKHLPTYAATLLIVCLRLLW